MGDKSPGDKSMGDKSMGDKSMGDKSMGDECTILTTPRISDRRITRLIRFYYIAIGTSQGMAAMRPAG